MSTRVTKRELLASTVVPTADGSTTKSDNAPPVVVKPVIVQATHAQIETTLRIIIKSEKSIEYARQHLAHLLFVRHDEMSGADKPALHALATNPAAFKAYLDVLCAEFKLIDPAALAVMSKTHQERYLFAMRTRLERALILATLLAWFKAQNTDKVCEWNAKDKRWSIHPSAFVTPSYTAGADLLMEKDGKTPRTVVQLEATDAAEYYWLAKGKGAPISINLSLGQFEYVVRAMIRASQNPTQDTSTIEATPARQSRAARTPVAGETAAAEDVDAQTSDTPEATAPAVQTDRAWRIGQLKRNLVAVEQLLDHDTMADLSWSDFDKNMHNAMATIAMTLDRMNAKDKVKQPVRADATRKATGLAA